MPRIIFRVPLFVRNKCALVTKGVCGPFESSRTQILRCLLTPWVANEGTVSRRNPNRRSSGVLLVGLSELASEPARRLKTLLEPSFVPNDAVQPSLAPAAEGALSGSGRQRARHSWSTIVDLYCGFLNRRLLTHSNSTAAALKQRGSSLKQLRSVPCGRPAGRASAGSLEGVQRPRPATP